MANGIVLNIDTTKSEFQNPMIELRQGDGNYQSLDVTVTSNGSLFNLTGWTITFMGTTAGGFKIVDTAVSNVDAANGKFTYTPTKSWGQDEGMFKEAYFKFTSGANGNSVASGASLRVNVLEAVDLTAAEAGDYISIVDQTISKLNGDLSKLQTSVNDLKSQNNAIKTTDNTWTGSNTFSQLINGYTKTRISPSTDLNLIIIPGKYELRTAITYTNLPSGVPDNAVLIVENDYRDTTTYQYILSRDTVNKNTDMTIFFRVRINGNWSLWKEIAKDENVVHKTGSETITGDKTFLNKILPSAIEISSGTPYIDFHFNNSTADYTSRAIETSSGVLNINSVELAGGTIKGSLIGNADTATKLRNARKINGANFDGTSDVTINPIVQFIGSSVDVFTLSNGYYYISSSTRSQNIPNEAGPYFYIEVITTSNNGFMRLIDYRGKTFFITKDFSWGTWKEIAKDENVVHKTGSETITGDKTFMSGAYGLRITSTGIQKTTNNGATWVNI